MHMLDYVGVHDSMYIQGLINNKKRYMQINHITKVTYTKGNAEALTQAQAQGKYKAGEWLTFLQAREIGKQIIKGSKGIRLCRVFATDKGELGKEKKAVKNFSVFNIEQVTSTEKAS